MLPNTVTVLLSPLMTWNYLKYVTVSKSMLRWAFLSTALSRLRLLCTLLCGVQTGSSCTIVHSYVVFLSDYWYFCPHVCPHGVHGQSNPGIVDYSDAFPIIKFRNFVFVGILTSRQLDWSTANKWTQIAQWNSAHLELLMGVRWVYVLTLEPHNIWICCNSCIRAISPGLQNGLYSAVQCSTVSHCTLVQNCRGGAAVRREHELISGPMIDDRRVSGFRIQLTSFMQWRLLINWISWTVLLLVACDSLSHWLKWIFLLN